MGIMKEGNLTNAVRVVWLKIFKYTTIQMWDNAQFALMGRTDAKSNIPSK